MFEQNIAELLEEIENFDALLIADDKAREELWKKYCDLEDLQYAAIEREEAALAS